MNKLLPALAFPLLLSACATAPVEPMTVAGPDFLTRNATVKKVVTTASGLQYFVLKAGPKTGRSPVEGDTVTVGNLTLHVYETPGHTPGHVIFHHPESKLALVR